MSRCLLHHVAGPKSFKNLKTVGTHICHSFTEAAQKHGLLASDDIYYRAMDDAGAEISNFRKLQRYFAMLLYHGRPNDQRKFFDEYIDSMNPPISVNNPNIMPKSKEIRAGEILRNLEYFFNCMGTSCRLVLKYHNLSFKHFYKYFAMCRDMGLPAPPMDYDFETQAETLGAADLLDDFFGGETLRNSPQKFVRNQVESLNADQRLAFDRISSVISGTGDQQRLFFVEGAGGCGIFLFIVLISGSMTVHSVF